MARNLSIFSSSRNRWIGYFVLVGVAWLLYACVSGPVSEYLSSHYGEKIVSATKNRIIDPARFVHQRLFDSAYLFSIVVVFVAVIDGVMIALRSERFHAWRFVPVALAFFVGLNLALIAAWQTSLFWVVSYAPAPDLRLPAAAMGEKILWESAADTKTGMIIGSSQMNAYLGVEHLNRLLDGDALFADVSYIGGFPFTVNMLQHSWERNPDIAIWYLTMLDLNAHRMIGASAQTLMTVDAENDVIRLEGEEVLGDLRMRYARIGRWLPMFRLRRAAESVVFGLSGTPEITPHDTRYLADKDGARGAEEKELRYSQFVDQLTKGDNGLGAHEKAKKFQKACLELVIDRFEAAGGTELVIIIGHVLPRAETLLPEKRKELLQYVRTVAEGKSFVHVIDDELLTPPTEHFSDFTHIDGAYRNDYTRAVFELLRGKRDILVEGTDAGLKAFTIVVRCLAGPSYGASLFCGRSTTQYRFHLY